MMRIHHSILFASLLARAASAEDFSCPANQVPVATMSTTTLPQQTCVQDLAQPYEYNDFQTSDAEEIIELAKNESSVAGFVALECGKVVAEYYRENLTDSFLFHCWSMTKSWSALLFGVMEKEGLLSVQETLGDIWPNETVWANVSDAEARKQITIESILQMRGGLSVPE